MALLWRGGPLAGPNAADSPRACSDDTCTHTPFRLDDLQVLAQLRPTLVPEQDRVGWYLSQWVARAHPPDAPVADPAEPSGFRRFLCVGSGYAPSNTLVDDAAVCLQLARHALRTSKDVAAFYREHGPRYDGFREALLPGRERLMRFGLPWQRRPAAWLSVGCGTARDLEYVLWAM